MIVHADVRNVMGHAVPGAIAAELEELFVARGVILQNSRAVDKALRPFRPAACGVFSATVKTGVAEPGFSAGIDGENLRRRSFPEFSGSSVRDLPVEERS